MADIESDLYDVIDSLQAGIARLDAFVAGHDTELPPRSLSRIAHARGEGMHLVVVLQTVPNDLAAAAEREARRAPDRAGAAKSAFGDFEVMMTAKLIAAGQLPADATPADFVALQAKRGHETAEIAQLGSVGDQLAKLAGASPSTAEETPE